MKKLILSLFAVFAMMTGYQTVEAGKGWGWGAAGLGTGLVLGSAMSRPRTRTVYVKEVPDYETREERRLRKKNERLERRVRRLEDRLEDEPIR